VICHARPGQNPQDPLIARSPHLQPIDLTANYFSARFLAAPHQIYLSLYMYYVSSIFELDLAAHTNNKATSK
jgi:hypothetical protein